MKKQVCYYDIEVLSNFFLCCVKIGNSGQVITFEISERKNELMDMITFFLDPSYIFAGYNCMGYDTPIMNMIIENMRDFIGESYEVITTKAYQLSATIISGEQSSWQRYRWADNFKQIDLMTLLASTALRVGLKVLQVTMFYENVQEMVVDWTKPVKIEDMDDMIFYCHNDVNSTAKLGLLLQGQLSLRQSISKQTGIPNLLSKDPVGTGVEVFTADICKQLRCTKQQLKDEYRYVPPVTSYRDLIQPCIKFNSPVLNHVLDWYKNSQVTADDIVTTPSGVTPKGKRIVDKTILFNKLQHTFAQGGIHSVNKPKIYEATADMRIIDIDAESLYPSLAGLFNFGPAGFAKEFGNIIRSYKAERVIAKAIGKDKTGKYSPEEKAEAKIEDQTKKLSLNSIIGWLRQKYGPYMAPQANAAICINGQLMLGMLIERMEDAGFECIMSNTDGITLLVPRTRYEEFKALYKQWESETGLKMEETEYEKMVIMAVNDYVAYKGSYTYMKDGEEIRVPGYSDVKDTLRWDDPEDVLEYNYAFIKTTPNNDKVSDYVKAKGMFGYYARLGKGLDCLIVAKALIDYFGKGIPVEETIENSLYIYDYVTYQKIGKQYDVIHNGQKVQHINRFYVSKRAPFLYKSKETTKTDKKSGITTTGKSMESVIAGKGIQLFNKYEEKAMRDYEIDYSYYIVRARDIIRALEPEQLALFKK